MSATRYGFTRFDTLSEFKSWIVKQPTYGYTGLQVHHTYLPDYSCFYKKDGSHEDELTRQYNTKKYHVNTNGWSNIAQHFTVFPNGKIVTGRPLSSTTAIGIKGWNTKKICIEIYGNFDKGHDVMTKEQKEAVICLYGELCKKHKITPSTSTIRCHCWFTAGGTYLGTYKANRSAKTCPGTNFMGFGNSKEAIVNNFYPLFKNYIAGNTTVTTPSTTTSYKTGIYRVIVETLNVRSGPGSSYSKVGEVQRGGAYTIDKIEGNWGHLKSGLGWICIIKDYCEFVSAAANTFKKYLVKCMADNLNCRKGPGTNYATERQIHKGDVFTVVAEKDGWVQSASGYWCSKSYVEFIRYV